MGAGSRQGEIKQARTLEGQDASPEEDNRTAPAGPAESPSYWSPGEDRKGTRRGHLTLKTGSLRDAFFPPTVLLFFSICIGELCFGSLIHTLKNTCSKAITQDALNRLDICLALHKPFIVS